MKIEVYLEFRIGRALGSRYSSIRAARRGLFDLTSLEAFDADIDASDRSIRKENFGCLEVRVEAAARNAGNLFTNTAGFFCQTTSDNRVSH